MGEALQVLRDFRTFSSAYGTGFRSRDDARFPQTPGYATMNLSDPPEHGRLRRLFPTELPGPGECLLASGDFVRQTARPLSERLARALFPGDVAELLRRIAYAEDPDYRTPGLTADQSGAKADHELRELVQGDWNKRLLLVSSQETTAAALSGTALELARRPDQFRLLQRHPELLPGAVEEILRWCSPVGRFGRLATRPVTLGDQRIGAGERVVVFFPAANRRLAPDFDVRRPHRHIAFGAGPHRCPGAPYVRLQMRSLLARMLEVGPPRLLEEPEFYRSSFTLGCKRLILEFPRSSRPAGGAG